MKPNIFYVLNLIFLLLLPSGNSYAQLKEEKEEKSLIEQIIQRKKMTYKLNMQAELFFGYDSNVRLDGARKGDGFQEFLFYLQFEKPLVKNLDIGFNFKHILDALNYNEVTSASNLLNSLVFEFNKEISIFKIGTGYDFTYLYYPHYKDGDYLFHKGFIYIGNDITNNLYQQLKVYYGIKDYLDGKALGDSSGSYQGKDRLDRRQHIEYSLRYNYNKDLTLRIKGGYSVNNSNARYIDYYDYESPESSFGFDYRLKPDLYFLLDYSYQKKNYKDRIVTLRNYKQKDNLYSINLGLIYLLNTKNSLSLKYIFREDSSNDSLSEYSENIISCSWQYHF